MLQSEFENLTSYFEPNLRLGYRYKWKIWRELPDIIIDYKISLIDIISYA